MDLGSNISILFLIFSHQKESEALLEEKLSGVLGPASVEVCFNPYNVRISEGFRSGRERACW
jgi:hypothetical protein